MTTLTDRFGLTVSATSSDDIQEGIQNLYIHPITTDVPGDLSVGGVTTTDTIVFRSDRRLKTDITPIEESLSKICDLTGYEYTMNGRNDIGVIAQEVSEVLPQVVHGSEEEGYTVAYANMVAVLINAVKELNEKVDYLEQKLDDKGA